MEADLIRIQTALRKGDLKQAIALCEELSQNEAVLGLLGSLYLKAGEKGKALDAFNRLCILRPEDVNLRKDIAHLFLQGQHFEEALAFSQAALDIDPRHPASLLNLSAALLGLQRFEEALSTLNTLLSIQPSHPSALVNKSTALLGLKRYEEALEAMDKALSLDAVHPGLLLNRLGALIATGRIREAEGQLKELLSRYRPSKASIINILEQGIAYLMMKHRPAEAVEVCELGLKHFPEDSRLLSAKETALKAS